MSLVKSIAAALVLGSASFLSAAPAISAPLGVHPTLASTVPTLAENVQYRRYGYGRGGYGYGRGGYGYGRRGFGGSAVLGGLAAGAIIGGAIAAGSAANAVDNNAAYCSQRYRSYDAASGTYLSTDGNRYACP